MSLEQINQILKSKDFEVTNHKKQNFRFRFTEVQVFRDDLYVCDYILSERLGNFFIDFNSMQQNIWVGDFKNVLIVKDDLRFVVNQDLTSFKGTYDIIFE
jgi:hypothetical protein